MRKAVTHVILAFALALVAWSVGRAQGSIADFEIVIDAPGPGQVNLTCVRGCRWGQNNTTYFSCRGVLERCSGRVDGNGAFLRHSDGSDNRAPLTPQAPAPPR